MTSLTPRLNTIKGPTKSVIDSGPIIDPAIATAQGLGQVADAVGSVVGMVQTKNRQAASDARAIRGEQRAERAAERAEITFANTLEDRSTKAEDDRFKDSLAAALRSIGKTKSAADQGRTSPAAIRLQTEKVVNSLLTEFPTYDAELNEGFKEAGLSHLILSQVEDEVSRAENQREAEEKAQADMFNVAVERGLVSPSTPFEKGVEMGQQLLMVEARNNQLKQQADLIEQNQRISQADRKFQLELLDKQARKNAAQSSNILGGAVVQGIMDNIGDISTPEQFSELQRLAPTKVAELENTRQELYSLYGYLPDAMEQIDKDIDRYKAYVEDAVSGDLSYAKGVARKLETIQKNGKLTLYEALPGLATIEGTPKSFQDSFFGTVGVQLAGDPELTKGFSDSMAGIISESAKTFTTTMDYYNNDTPIKDIPSRKVQQKVLKVNATTHAQAVKTMMSNVSPDEKTEATVDFVEANRAMLPVLAAEIGDTRDSLKEIEGASKVFFNPQSLSALEQAMKTPATQEEASIQMDVSRGLMHRSIQSLKRNTDDSLLSPFNVTFDENVGRFEVTFDEAQAQKILRSTPNVGFQLMRGSNPSLDSDMLENMKQTGERSGAQRKAAQMNQMLDMLVKTREHDTSVSTAATEAEYRKAYATNDFSSVDVTNATALSEPIENVTAKLEGNIVAVPLKDSDPVSTTVMVSKFKTPDTETAGFIDASAASVGVPSALMHAIADQESGAWRGEERHKIRGDGGKAMGVFQIHKAAATEAGFEWEELEDPAKNAQAASNYMGMLIDDFKGDVKDALLAYNAGETKVRSWIRRGRPLGEPWQKNAFPYAEQVLERIESGVGYPQEDTAATKDKNITPPSRKRDN